MAAAALCSSPALALLLSTEPSLSHGRTPTTTAVRADATTLPTPLGARDARPSPRPRRRAPTRPRPRRAAAEPRPRPRPRCPATPSTAASSFVRVLATVTPEPRRRSSTTPHRQRQRPEALQRRRSLDAEPSPSSIDDDAHEPRRCPRRRVEPAARAPSGSCTGAARASATPRSFTMRP